MCTTCAHTVTLHTFARSTAHVHTGHSNDKYDVSVRLPHILMRISARTTPAPQAAPHSVARSAPLGLGTTRPLVEYYTQAPPAPQQTAGGLRRPQSNCSNLAYGRNEARLGQNVGRARHCGTRTSSDTLGTTRWSITHPFCVGFRLIIFETDGHTDAIYRSAHSHERAHHRRL